MATTQIPINPLKNQLLAALPAASYDRLRPHLKPMALQRGQALYEAGERLESVYFPIDAIISLLNVLKNGTSGEIAVIGNEGIVGIALLLGNPSMPTRAVVQSAGHGYRLAGHLFKQE